MTVPKLLASFVLILLCASSAVLAIDELRTAAQVQTVRQVRRVMEQPTADLRPVLERTRLSGDTILASCKSQAVEAAVELDVFYADSFNPQLERDQWLIALNKLSNDARAALACQPTNGLLWARLAFAEWFLGRSADQQVQMLEYSELYAPAELAALKARLIHWGRMTPYVLQGAKTSYDRDLWTLALWMPPSRVSELWQGLSPTQKSAFAQLKDAMPADRSNELSKRGVVLDSADKSEPKNP